MKKDLEEAAQLSHYTYHIQIYTSIIIEQCCIWSNHWNGDYHQSQELPHDGRQT